MRRTWALMLAALVVRMAIWALRPGLTYDGTYYLRQAERIFHLDFQVIGFPPGHPLVVAFVRLLAGDFELLPDLTAYVNEVGQKLAVHAERKLPYEFVVLNSSVPNARNDVVSRCQGFRGMTRFLEVVRDELRYIAIVFDDQDVAHGAACKLPAIMRNRARKPGR